VRSLSLAGADRFYRFRCVGIDASARAFPGPQSTNGRATWLVTFCQAKDYQTSRYQRKKVEMLTVAIRPLEQIVSLHCSLITTPLIVTPSLRLPVLRPPDRRGTSRSL
jgi:hypothetical protein